MEAINTQDTEEAARHVERLLGEVERERQKRKTRSRIFNTLFALFFALMVGFTLLKWWKTGKFHGDNLTNFGWMFSLLGCAAAATQAQKKAVTELSQFDDLRGVSALAEALEFDDKDVQRAASDTLIRLLPQMQASDAHLLDEERRHTLNHVIEKACRSTKAVPLAKAILQAYEQVGGEKELEAVKALASRTESKKAEIREAAEAARECLPALTQRVELEKASKSLLRASSAFEVSPAADTLLRPAISHVSNIDAMELLRAASAEAAPFDTELLRRILRDLETTGDVRALPYVESLSHSPTLPIELRDAARRCLIRIQERGNNEDALCTHPRVG